MISTIFWICVFVLYSLTAFYWVWALYKGAPYYPSNGKVVKQILKILQKYPGAKIAELGAGEGRIAVPLAKAGFKVTAVEINPLLTVIMRVRKLLDGLKNLEVINGDIFKQNYANYEVIVMYLLPQLMYKLEPVLYSQLSKKAIIISNTFKFKDHQPDEVYDKVCVYIVK
jgi:protein-L-isoaspartate O-methyltransferase